MPIKQYKPTSPGRRDASGYTFSEITKDTPEKSLVGSESKYNLPGFIWRTDRPKLGRNLSVVALPFENSGRAGVGK